MRDRSRIVAACSIIAMISHSYVIKECGCRSACLGSTPCSDVKRGTVNPKSRGPLNPYCLSGKFMRAISDMIIFISSNTKKKSRISALVIP
jgi:hypothetical protein